MSSLLAFLSKLADRPSTVWRVAWLVFCLTVLCFFGTQTLQKVTPYVLAGIGGEPAAPLLPEGVKDAVKEDSPFTTWILPVVSWTILAGLIAAAFMT
jgi:hypothetical protein